MPYKRLSSFALCAVLSCSACQVICHDYHGSRQLTPGTRLLSPSRYVADVYDSKKALYVFFGLIPINDASGAQLAEDAAIEQHGENFAGITHIQIDEYNSAVDIVVNVFLGILFSMRTVEVRGRIQENAG